MLKGSKFFLNSGRSFVIMRERYICSLHQRRDWFAHFRDRPGIAIVGFGFVDKVGSKVTPVQYGCIQTEAHTPDEESAPRLRGHGATY